MNRQVKKNLQGDMTGKSKKEEKNGRIGINGGIFGNDLPKGGHDERMMMMMMMNKFMNVKVA